MGATGHPVAGRDGLAVLRPEAWRLRWHPLPMSYEAVLTPRECTLKSPRLPVFDLPSPILLR